MPSLRRRTDRSPAATIDPVLIESKDRLRSLHDHCLTNLVAGLDAMRTGDLAVRVDPATTPITATANDPVVAELVALFISMLDKAQTALEGYNDVRDQMRSALGDHSRLRDLHDRLVSLSDKCLTGLGRGLPAAAESDPHC